MQNEQNIHWIWNIIDLPQDGLSADRLVLV